MAKYALAETFVNRWTNTLFMTGKTMRLGMALLFLFLLSKNVSHLAGYTTGQVIIFFLSFQILDTLNQMLYRGVYLFSWQVKSGELDFYLAKPINPLFRILTGKPDILDALFFLPQTALSIWLILQFTPNITLASFATYLLLLFNGFLITTGMHILVICLGVLTTEVDNAILLYRDLNNLGRFPIDIYREPFRTILFWIVPIGLINTIPAQVLLNLKPSYGLAFTFAVGILFFLISLRVWNESIKKYTSAGG